jgi:hypothetical protein
MTAHFKPYKDLPNPLPSVPKLPPDLIPASLRPWVVDIAERMGCPVDFPGAAAMVCLSSVVGRQLAIRPMQNDDWTVVPNLWGAVVGRPGMLKSPALAEVKRPLRELEQRARREHEQALLLHKAGGKVRAAASKAAEKVIEAEVKNRNFKEAERLATEAVQQEEVPAPERRRYVTNDTTVEKLGELLSVNPRGLLVFRDELTGWLLSLDKQGQEGARSFFLEAWNGNGDFTSDRIGRGTIDIDATCVSVLGGIQPGPLSMYLRHALDGGTGDDGLLQRLQLAVWPDAPDDWDECDRPPDREAREAAFQTFFRLDRIDPVAVGATILEGGIPYVRFDADAQELFREWRGDLEYTLRRFDGHPAIEAVTAKQRSLVPSIALLIHLADNPQGGPVSCDALRMAIDWAEYLAAHSKRIFAPALFGPLTAARELARHIRKGKLPDVFQAKFIYDKGWAGLTDSVEVGKALDVLENYGWVCSVEQRTKGRPRTDWHLHPELRPVLPALRR